MEMVKWMWRGLLTRLGMMAAQIPPRRAAQVDPIAIDPRRGDRAAVAHRAALICDGRSSLGERAAKMDDAAPDHVVRQTRRGER